VAWKGCGGLGKAAVGLKRLWRARGGCGWLGKDVEVRKGSGGLGEAVESELGEAVVGLERMWRARKGCGGLREAVES
jgi:hypothetical protein